MTQMTDTAKAFFEACETGQGWAACAPYCTPDATFTAQSEPLAEVRTVKDYAEWMKGVLVFMPDARYEMKSFAADAGRQNVCAYAVFKATHTGEGGPCPPTGRRTESDYVFAMQFSGGKVSHVTKIWNSGWALKELGWV